MKKKVFAMSLIPGTIFIILVSVIVFNVYSLKNKPVTKMLPQDIDHGIFIAMPKVMGSTSTSINSAEGMDELICRYLEKYHSPMTKTCREFTAIFSQKRVDPIFALAIAQCESNLGEKMPIPISNGCYDNIQPGEQPEECCHNPFGWGVHSAGTLCSTTWEEGYGKVAGGLKNKYFNEGLVTTEDIMSKYNKISAVEKNGSWAKCVNQFVEEIEELKVRMY